MIRNLKVLGLALVAVFAMSAVMASAASATVTPFWFTSDGDWTALHGEQGSPIDKFETDGIVGVAKGVISCTTTTYKGSTSATTTTTMTLTPEYKGCNLEPFGSAEVHMNGCSYVFHADNDTGGTPAKYDVETTIECPVGQEITITAEIGGVSKCVVHVEPQNLGTGVVLENGTGTLSATINFANIKYTQTAGTGAGKCSTTTTTNNGVYVGKATIKGSNTAKEPTSISVST